MRKISLFLGLVLSFSISFAQSSDTWESLTKDKAKTDEEILDAKKNIKAKTWEKRGETYLSIAQFNTTGLYEGMQGKTVDFTKGIGADKVVGEPLSVVTEGTKEIWVYKNLKLTMENNVLQKWEEIQFIDEDAFKIAGEAFLKATELDPKSKEKSTTKDFLAIIRPGIVNKAIDLFYEKKQYDKSYDYINLSIKLAEFPKSKVDTFPNADIKVLNYYAGIISSGAKKYAEAEKHFQYCVDNKYEPGMSLHYVATTYLDRGDSTKYAEKVVDGFNKYPETEQLVIDLINYYIAKNQQEEVIKYIDLAISKNPSNPSYFSAKASVYDNQDEEIYKKYRVLKDEFKELKKLSLRTRNDKVEGPKNEKLRDQKLVEAETIQKKSVENLAKAEEFYKKAIEIDPKFFNSYYNLGTMYYKINERYRLEADDIFFSDPDKDIKTNEYNKKGDEALVTAASYFEKAFELNPTEKIIPKVLMSIFYKLKNTEKQTLYKQKLEQLEGGN